MWMMCAHCQHEPSHACVCTKSLGYVDVGDFSLVVVDECHKVEMVAPCGLMLACFQD